MMNKTIVETFYRLACSGLVPRKPFAPDLPALERDEAESNPPRPLRLEIVSHCWQYAHLLAYQLSSLILHPPLEVEVQMTVFHCPEDNATVNLLEHIGTRQVPRVTWNWQPMERNRLFRRCIGRNLAAKATSSDWLWFSDCDVIFYKGALDGAGDVLRGRDDFLLFPREHGITDMLESDDPLLRAGVPGSEDTQPPLLDIEPESFHPEIRDRAVGGFQIVRGDVARAAGYCGNIDFYQQPLARWQKTYEDRTFRWLLGTQGTAVELPALYRIRHMIKGRKTG